MQDGAVKVVIARIQK